MGTKPRAWVSGGWHLGYLGRVTREAYDQVSLSPPHPESGHTHLTALWDLDMHRESHQAIGAGDGECSAGEPAFGALHPQVSMSLGCSVPDGSECGTLPMAM